MVFDGVDGVDGFDGADGVDGLYLPDALGNSYNVSQAASKNDSGERTARNESSITSLSSGKYGRRSRQLASWYVALPTEFHCRCRRF